MNPADEQRALAIADARATCTMRNPVKHYVLYVENMDKEFRDVFNVPPNSYTQCDHCFPSNYPPNGFPQFCSDRCRNAYAGCACRHSKWNAVKGFEQCPYNHVKPELRVINPSLTIERVRNIDSIIARRNITLGAIKAAFHARRKQFRLCVTDNEDDPLHPDCVYRNSKGRAYRGFHLCRSTTLPVAIERYVASQLQLHMCKLRAMKYVRAADRNPNPHPDNDRIAFLVSLDLLEVIPPNKESAAKYDLTAADYVVLTLRPDFWETMHEFYEVVAARETDMLVGS